VSYDDGNELVDCEIFGMKFGATHQEQRDLWLKLSTSPQSTEWGRCRNLMTMLVSHNDLTPQIRDLADRMENADQAMTKLAHRLVGEMIAQRAA